MLNKYHHYLRASRYKTCWEALLTHWTHPLINVIKPQTLKISFKYLEISHFSHTHSEHGERWKYTSYKFDFSYGNHHSKHLSMKNTNIFLKLTNNAAELREGRGLGWYSQHVQQTHNGQSRDRGLSQMTVRLKRLDSGDSPCGQEIEEISKQE